MSGPLLKYLKKEFSPVLVFKNSPLQNLRENCGEVPWTETSVLHDKSNYPEGFEILGISVN